MRLILVRHVLLKLPICNVVGNLTRQIDAKNQNWTIKGWVDRRSILVGGTDGNMPHNFFDDQTRPQV